MSSYNEISPHSHVFAVVMLALCVECVYLLILTYRFWVSWEAAYQYISGSLELLCRAVAEVSLASFC